MRSIRWRAHCRFRFAGGIAIGPETGILWRPICNRPGEGSPPIAIGRYKYQVKSLAFRCRSLTKDLCNLDTRQRRFCMSSSPTTPESNEGQLGLFDAISIIIGIIIGAGIYETPAGIFRMMSGPWTTLGLWAICGLLALIGALCYAELATTYPR